MIRSGGSKIKKKTQLDDSNGTQWLGLGGMTKEDLTLKKQERHYFIY